MFFFNSKKEFIKTISMVPDLCLQRKTGSYLQHDLSVRLYFFPLLHKEDINDVYMNTTPL